MKRNVHILTHKLKKEQNTAICIQTHLLFIRYYSSIAWTRKHSPFDDSKLKKKTVNYSNERKKNAERYYDCTWGIWTYGLDPEVTCSLRPIFFSFRTMSFFRWKNDVGVESKLNHSILCLHNMRLHFSEFPYARCVKCSAIADSLSLLTFYKRPDLRRSASESWRPCGRTIESPRVTWHCFHVRFRFRSSRTWRS